MPIKNRKGEIISEGEVKIFAKMMKESLEDHAKVSAVVGASFLLGDQREVADYIIKNYREAIPTVDALFEAYAKGKESVSVEDIFQKVFSGVYEKSLKECKNYNDEDIEAAFQTLPQETGDYTHSQYYIKSYKKPQNDEETISSVADDFKLASEPMPGVSELTDFNPASDRIVGLAGSRMGNSTTYADLKDQMNRADKTELTEADKAAFGFYTAAETARVFSADFMQKKNIEFSDLYNAFTSINGILRTGDEGGGKMRGNQISAGSGKNVLYGVGSAKVPAAMYNTLDIIAGHMNEIKKTADPALRKTQAIQLAAFAYQMTLSEHLFGDANGRSCRILSDIVLQSFGLPPHTPSKDELSLCGTIGEKTLDFKKGAEVFLNGVQLSDKVVKEQKQAEKAKADPQELAKREQAAKEADDRQKEKVAKQKDLMDGVNDDLTKQVQDYRKAVKQARGTFHNSKEYDQFNIMVDAYASLIEQINKAKQEGQNQINVNGLNPVAKKIALGVLRNDVPKSGNIDFDDAGKLMQEFSDSLTQVAEKYEQYKMKDHTLDPQKEPDKKLLNKDDIRKMNLVHMAMNKNPLPNNLYKQGTRKMQNESSAKSKAESKNAAPNNSGLNFSKS